MPEGFFRMELPSNLLFRPPITKIQHSNLCVLSAFHGKEGLERIISVSAKLGAPNSKVSSAEDWEGPEPPSKISFSGKTGSSTLSKLSESAWEERAYEFIRKKKLRESLGDAQQSTRTPRSLKAVALPSKCIEAQVPKRSLIAGLELDEKCRPVVEYFLSLGIDQNTLQKILKRRSVCFYMKIDKVKERLGYLSSLGLKNEDIGKAMVRHPRLLEYTVAGMMMPRVQYLQSIGVPATRLGRVITACPALLEYSLEESLKRRVKFLIEDVGVKEQDISKIIVLSPQILTQSIPDSIRPRINFFLKRLGLSKEAVAKIVTKHPQLLHYSIQNGIQPRLDFFRSLGLSDPDITLVLSRCTQVLSLSVEKSLKPKCDYLTKELKCGLQTIVSFPAYLSLSLEHRIQPRHKFLKALGRLPVGPFPMCVFAVTDEDFCDRWANATVEEYNTFRQSLHLSNFAKRFARKNRLKFDN